ncbi:MAG: L-fucose/L-arabinose isomerase family protein [Planctomycetota bacterium]
MALTKGKLTFGVIMGNRGFFPDHLVTSGRAALLGALKTLGHTAVLLGEKDTNKGAVESYSDAMKCADLFNRHGDRIDGVIVSLPNFGDEKAVANTLKALKSRVPVLVHAEPDDISRMQMGQRRDSFCGKISVCNNLMQYGIPFTNTTLHTEGIASDTGVQDLRYFAAVCRVVKGLKQARFGAIGARTAPFNTVRYSEKILEGHGISVETLDLSEVIGRANRLPKGSNDLKAKIREITGYCDSRCVTKPAMDRMARFLLVVENWIKDQGLDATAIQCWTSLQENYGIVPCTVMSLMSNKGLPSACEVDITGTLSMYALQLAAGRPAAILDWNNNYGNDPDKTVLFHCSNIPVDMLNQARIGHQEIIADAVGKDNTYGPVFGRLKTGPFTFLRLTTDENTGGIRGYLGEGRLTDDPLDTFGGYGVAHIDEL